MMRYLILLRHGESADKQHGQADFERVLTTRGIDSIIRLAAHLSNEKIIPDYALVSPATRTKQTAQILLDALDLKLNQNFETDIFNGDDLVYKSLVESVSVDWNYFLLVGHNPSISALVGRLTQKSFVGLHPGQAAILTFDNKIEQSTLLKTIGPFM